MKKAHAQVMNTKLCPEPELEPYASKRGTTFELTDAPKFPHMFAHPKIAPVLRPPTSCMNAQIEGLAKSVISETIAQHITTPQTESIIKHPK
jgi:hypothetical protein